MKDLVLRPEDIPAGTVVIAKDVADQFRMESEPFRGERNVMLVQGAEATQIKFKVTPAEFNSAAATVRPV